MIQVLFRITIISMFVMSTCTALAQEDSPEEVISRAIGNRLQITSYDIEIQFLNEGGDSQRVPSGRYYLDHDKLRVDLRHLYTDSQRFPGLGEVDYWGRNVFTPSKLIDFNSMLLPGPGQRVVQIDTERERVHQSYAEAKDRHDIRSLGFHVTGVHLGYNINKVVKDLAQPGKSSTAEVVGGVDTIRVDFTLKSGVECSIWFATKCGYAPIKARGYFPPLQSSDEIDITLKQWKDTQIWFPSHYRAVRNYSKGFQQVEVADITVHSINQRLDEKTFDVGGLQVPVGRSVRTLPSAGPKQIWDGEKAVTKSAYKAPKE